MAFREFLISSFRSGYMFNTSCSFLLVLRHFELSFENYLFIYGSFFEMFYLDLLTFYNE